VSCGACTPLSVCMHGMDFVGKASGNVRLLRSAGPRMSSTERASAQRMHARESITTAMVALIF